MTATAAVAAVLVPCGVLLTRDRDVPLADPALQEPLPAVATTAPPIDTIPRADVSMTVPPPEVEGTTITRPASRTYVLYAGEAGVEGIGRSDGTDVIPLLAEPGARDLDVTPDGGWIVFTVDGEIRVLKADGSEVRPVSGEPGVTYQGPRVSPDGTTLAVIARQAGQLHLELAGLDGSFRRRIPTGFAPNQVDWAPDGTRVLLTGGLSDRLVLLDVETGEQTEVTAGPGPYASPRWSPDGTTIAWTDGTVVWLAPVAGGPARRLDATAADGVLDLLWLPDGSLLFTPARGAGGIRSITQAGELGPPLDRCCLGPAIG